MRTSGPAIMNSWPAFRVSSSGTARFTNYAWQGNIQMIVTNEYWNVQTLFLAGQSDGQRE